jgi:hypothetical protein
MEHRARVVPKHLLRDRVVAHQVRDVVGIVSGELHYRVHVVPEVDQGPVGGTVRDQLNYL